MLSKYDFSKYFGTINHEKRKTLAEMLNMSAAMLDFLTSYLEHQRYANIIVNDPGTAITYRRLSK